MTPKENALQVLRFGRPRWVPFGLPLRRLSYFGCDHQGYDGGGHHLPVGSPWTDIWGTVWRKEQEGVMGFPVTYPLADFPAAMRRYHWPDPDDPRLLAPLIEQARRFEQEDPQHSFLIGAHRDTLWEKAYMLVGMEKLMCALLCEPHATRELLGRIMDFQLGIARHYAAAGIEIAYLGDDLGTQRGPLLSPNLVAELLVPQYRRLIDFHKARGTLVNFHCCGHVRHLIEPFIALGVDVLNPVQATANDLDELRRSTRGRLALEGALDSAIIMQGPPDRIRHMVRRRLWQLGREGGYFCAPDQGLPWPEAHLQAARDAVRDFGRYPLQPPDDCPASSHPTR